MSFRQSFLVGITYLGCIFIIRILQNLLGGGDIVLAFFLSGLLATWLRASFELKKGNAVVRKDQLSLAVLLSILCLMSAFFVQIEWQTFVYPDIEVSALLLGTFATPFIVSNVMYNALKRREKRRL